MYKIKRAPFSFLLCNFPVPQLTAALLWQQGKDVVRLVYSSQKLTINTSVSVEHSNSQANKAKRGSQRKASWTDWNWAKLLTNWLHLDWKFHSSEGRLISSSSGPGLDFIVKCRNCKFYNGISFGEDIVL